MIQTPIVSFSLDLLLILRLSLAIAWGFAWAVFLQHARLGQFLAEERVWLTVTVGVGADLAISYGGDWWTVCFVVAASSAGVIARSLLNEQRAVVNPRSYRLLHRLEDATALVLQLATGIEERLKDKTVTQPELVHLAHMVALSNRIGDHLKAARNNQ
jgi:hypothetical protein